jgi:N-carbamoyl-L-amino-acid hydrolase
MPVNTPPKIFWDTDGVSVADALDSIGYRGSEAVGSRKFAGFVELHIEQGPILEAENETIGVVERGQGIAWYDGSITGFASHAGTTPMPLRHDALLALSELALAVEQAAITYGPNAVATIGEIKIENASRNVVPGEIHFTIDARSGAADILDKLHDAFRKAVTEIAARRGVGIELIPVWRKEPTVFDAGLVEAIAQSSRELGYASRRMMSGAIHDACNLSTVMPAAMIFVPCKDGISHNELEDATQADCTAGANVLLHTVLKLAGIADEKKG